MIRVYSFFKDTLNLKYKNFYKNSKYHNLIIKNSNSFNSFKNFYFFHKFFGHFEHLLYYIKSIVYTRYTRIYTI